MDLNQKELTHLTSLSPIGSITNTNQLEKYLFELEQILGQVKARYQTSKLPSNLIDQLTEWGMTCHIVQSEKDSTDQEDADYVVVLELVRNDKQNITVTLQQCRDREDSRCCYSNIDVDYKEKCYEYSTYGFGFDENVKQPAEIIECFRDFSKAQDPGSLYTFCKLLADLFLEVETLFNDETLNLLYQNKT